MYVCGWVREGALKLIHVATAVWSKKVRPQLLVNKREGDYFTVNDTQECDVWKRTVHRYLNITALYNSAPLFLYYRRVNLPMHRYFKGHNIAVHLVNYWLNTCCHRTNLPAHRYFLKADQSNQAIKIELALIGLLNLKLDLIGLLYFNSISPITDFSQTIFVHHTGTRLG